MRRLAGAEGAGKPPLDRRQDSESTSKQDEAGGVSPNDRFPSLRDSSAVLTTSDREAVVRSWQSRLPRLPRCCSGDTAWSSWPASATTTAPELTDYGYLDELCARHTHLKRYLPPFLALLPFRAERGGAD